MTPASRGQSPDFGRERFIEMLLHDDRNSFYHVMRRRRSGRGKGRLERVHGMKARHLRSFKFSDDFEWYITHNGFVTPTSRRSENCRQLNSLVCDVDFHGKGCDYGYLSELALALLEAGWTAGRFPEPTAVVLSGRGLHCYWALERSTSAKLKGGSPNDRGRRFFHDMQDRVYEAVKGYIEPLLAEARVDPGVSDDSRMLRVPGSINEKSRSRCELVHFSERYYHLEGLAKVLPKAKKNKKRLGSRAWVRPSKGAAASASRKDRCLAKARVDALEGLQELRGFGCRGSRELMCFLHYNFNVQVEGPGGAFASLVAFNERFEEPIPLWELENVRKSVDRNGPYRYENDTIANLLSLDEGEHTVFFMSAKDRRRAEKKRVTAEKRAKRDRGIRYADRLGLTVGAIAEEFRCCETTVRNVLGASRGADARDLPGEEAVQLWRLVWEACRTAPGVGRQAFGLGFHMDQNCLRPGGAQLLDTAGIFLRAGTRVGAVLAMGSAARCLFWACPCGDP